MNFNISSQQLRCAADLKERIDALEAELISLLGGSPERATGSQRGMSAAGRGRIAAAAKARWARWLAGQNGETTTRRPRRRMSAAARAKIAAAARARWRKAKAAGKNAL